MKVKFDDPEFDFVKEFRKLYVASPCCGAYTRASENCPYGDIVVVSKNCYMCFNCGQSEDCCYCENSRALIDSYDCGYSEKCELCYECVDCDDCYNCYFCQDSSNSRDLKFCYDMRRCKDCIGCVGLRDKQYYIFNQQFSKEQYEKKAVHLSPLQIQEKLEELKLKIPRVYSHQHDTENCTGDYIYHSKNTRISFDARHSEDSAFIVMANLDRGAKDSFDCGPMPTGMDLCYDQSYAHYLFNCRHLYFCGNLKDCRYVNNCFEAENLFGCCYLTKKYGRFYILNQEVDEETYKRITAKIVKNLYARGVWSFYDLVYKDLPDCPSLCPKEETVFADAPPFKVVQDLELKRECQICRESFELFDWEIEYYKKHRIRYPIYCPSCRMEQRIKLRNEWKLYKRKCGHCKKDIISTYTPDTRHTVYCFECFWGEMG